MEIWGPFSAKSDLYDWLFDAGNLTFDDQKTVLIRYYLVICVKCGWLSDYEYLMADYRREPRARLEKVMAEMDSLNAWEIESQVKTVLSKLGIEDLNAKGWGSLSGGLRRRVRPPGFAVSPWSALLDEPTNHLDIDASNGWPLLENSKKTVLLITHDRYFWIISQRGSWLIGWLDRVSGQLPRIMSA